METQRQWSDRAILRTTPVLLGLFSLITLWADDLARHSVTALRPNATVWYHKTEPTFSDAIAAVRRFGNRFRPSVIDARKLAGSGLAFYVALCARVLMHFPLAEQIEFLRNVTSTTQQRVVFTQGLDTGYHRLRRGVKRLLRNQTPAVYPLTPADLRKLIAAAGLRELRRYRVLPLISESIVVVCQPVSHGRPG